MQKKFEIEQGVPEIWGLKWSEMILLRETKKRKNCCTTALCVWKATKGSNGSIILYKNVTVELDLALKIFSCKLT